MKLHSMNLVTGKEHLRGLCGQESGCGRNSKVDGEIPVTTFTKATVCLNWLYKGNL